MVLGFLTAKNIENWARRLDRAVNVSSSETFVRRWYKLGWEQDPAFLIDKIRAGVMEGVEA